MFVRFIIAVFILLFPGCAPQKPLLGGVDRGITLFLQSGISEDVAPPANGEKISRHKPTVADDEQSKPLLVPWYKRPSVWIWIIGLLGGTLLIADDDTITPVDSEGTLIITGPSL